jgi:hypothetical protein
MQKTISYGLILTGTLLACSINSWGSEPLPQLFNSQNRVNIVGNDTIPLNETPVVQEQETAAKNTEPVTQAVVKKVPKSRKKLKPVAVQPTVKAPPVKIVKPKIVVKKINVTVP